jgi:hypothetical protein
MMGFLVLFVLVIVVLMLVLRVVRFLESDVGGLVVHVVAISLELRGLGRHRVHMLIALVVSSHRVVPTLLIMVLLLLLVTIGLLLLKYYHHIWSLHYYFCTLCLGSSVCWSDLNCLLHSAVNFVDRCLASAGQVSESSPGDSQNRERAGSCLGSSPLSNY